MLRFMSRRTWCLPLALFAATSCEGARPLGPPEPLGAVVLTPHAWSGGEVMVRVRPLADLPVALAGAETLAVRHVDDSTFAMTIPDTNGTLAIELRGAAAPETVSVRAYGFVDRRVAASLRNARLTSAAGGPRLIGDDSVNLVRLDLQTLAAETLPAGLHRADCGHGPGAGYGGRLVLFGDATRCDFARVFVPLAGGGFTLEDSLATVIGPSLFLASIGAGTWIKAGSNTFQILHAGSGAVVLPLGGSDYDVALSPRGDRAVPLNAQAAAIPVFDATGAQVYAIASSQELPAAVFSPGGDTLFVAPTVNGAMRLTAIDATSGAGLGSAPGGGSGLALDPDGRFLYAFVNTGAAVIDVYDRFTLALVARLRSSVPLGGCAGGCRHPQMVIDAAARQLIVAVGDSYGSLSPAPVVVARYDLLP